MKMKISWNQERAKQLLNDYNTRWNKSREYGITGRRDNSGKVTAATVLDAVLNHGVDQESSRSKRTFNGAARIYEILEGVVDDPILLPADQAAIAGAIKDIISMQNSDADPANIPYINQVVSFDGEGKPERKTIYGHFLTEDYVKYRMFRYEQKKRKAEEEGGTPPTRPDLAPANDERGWWSESENTARPPFHIAIFDDKIGLLGLALQLKQLAEKTVQPKENVAQVIRLTRAKAPQLARLSGAKNMVESILKNPNIYARGKRAIVVKERLNKAFSDFRLQVTEADMELLSKQSIVRITDDDGNKAVLNLETVPKYQKVKVARLAFPKSNILLNQFIREVMGEEALKNFEVADRELPGVILKSVTLLDEAENIAASLRGML